MARIKQSATGWSFIQGDLTPEGFIRGAAEVGLAAVELVDQEYWPLVKELGLDIATFVGHSSLPDGLNKRENHDRIEDELLANIELAAANDIRPSTAMFITSLTPSSSMRAKRARARSRVPTAGGWSRAQRTSSSSEKTGCRPFLRR